jgi:PIN domain nuclease of toxin-antitoxin system
LRLLLDTHCLLWALMTPEHLSERVRNLLRDPRNEVLVSAASAWEVATKHRLGRLPEAESVVGDYPGALAKLMALELPVSSSHALLAGSFSNAHRDPFDRLLAAQATLERVPLATLDGAFRDFPVRVLW